MWKLILDLSEIEIFEGPDTLCKQFEKFTKKHQISDDNYTILSNFKSQLDGRNKKCWTTAYLPSQSFPFHGFNCV